MIGLLNVKSKKSLILKSFIALMLSSVLVLGLFLNSKPAKALQVILNDPSSSSVTVGTTVTFNASIVFTNPNEIVPIASLELDLTGPNNHSITFAPLSLEATGSTSVLSVTAGPHTALGAGYGYAFGYAPARYGYVGGYASNFGGGYGYGPVGAFTSAVGYIRSFDYTFTVNTTTLSTGTYNLAFKVNTGSGVIPQFTSAQKSFTVTSSGGTGGGQPPPVVCQPGTYLANSTNCLPCPAGSFSNSNNSANCDACPPGLISSQSGSSSCTPCPAGKYSSLSGSTACAVCPPGLFSSTDGSNSCTPCAVGTFTSEPGRPACLPVTVCVTANEHESVAPTSTSDRICEPNGTVIGPEVDFSKLASVVQAGSGGTQSVNLNGSGVTVTRDANGNATSATITVGSGSGGTATITVPVNQFGTVTGSPTLNVAYTSPLTDSGNGSKVGGQVTVTSKLNSIPTTGTTTVRVVSSTELPALTSQSISDYVKQNGGGDKVTIGGSIVLDHPGISDLGATTISFKVELQLPPNTDTKKVSLVQTSLNENDRRPAVVPPGLPVPSFRSDPGQSCTSVIGGTCTITGSVTGTWTKTGSTFTVVILEQELATPTPGPGTPTATPVPGTPTVVPTGTVPAGTPRPTATATSTPPATGDVRFSGLMLAALLGAGLMMLALASMTLRRVWKQ